MTDFCLGPMPADSTTADRAVAYLLRRIQNDARLAYYFPLTESLALLTAAFAEARGLDLETFRREFTEDLRTTPPLCAVCLNLVEL